MTEKRRPAQPRADRVLPGVWRLRLPLPWPGVPHGNAWAVATDDGITLFDTGIGGEGRLAKLEAALTQAGFGLKDVKLVVCTHTHADHYGLAGPIVDASGAELWVHPKWDHVRRYVEDPEGALLQRIEVARQSGVPAAALEQYEKTRRGESPTIERLVPPDRELLPGVEVPTDLGAWQVYETPGHAPSHVCLHQPDRRLLISGDHLLGRISRVLRLRPHSRPRRGVLRGARRDPGARRRPLPARATDAPSATCRRRSRRRGPRRPTSSAACATPSLTAPRPRSRR